MWYVVDMLFAQKPTSYRAKLKCEVCNVLFEAASALDACRKAQPWADEHSRDGGFFLVGIQHVRSLLDPPGDGVEIGGSFFDEIDPWGRKAELIPDLNEIPTIKFEQNPEKPVGELISDETKKQLREVLGEE
jgi:hypothetical protein